SLSLAKGTDDTSEAGEVGLYKLWRSCFQTYRQSLSALSSSKRTKSSPRHHPAKSFEKLLSSKYGLCAFTAFLVSEFSEENIAFYFACEEYKNTKSPAKLSAKAQKIYDEFIGSDAPREINIDHETRDITKANMLVPSPSCFDMAQHKIYMLMAKDCYPRFLRSPAYGDLVCQAKPSTKATNRTGLQMKARSW
uniref:Regulator of G-protein signaling 5-like n=1 Tax=Sphaeramia orbicularis TaxID=375764 RepID=A0A672YWT0_9TELE